jgi:hypothetical protein
MARCLRQLKTGDASKNAFRVGQLVMMLRADGYHIPVVTHGDDADGRGAA